MIDPRTAKINELKETSIAYANWRFALSVRDQIGQACGTSDDRYQRAQVHVKFWHDEWKTEESKIVADAPKELEIALNGLDAALDAASKSGEMYPIRPSVQSMIEEDRAIEKAAEESACNPRNQQAFLSRTGANKEAEEASIEYAAKYA